MSAPYSSKNFTPLESIGYLLKRAGHQLTLTVDRKLAPLGLTHAQIGIFLKLLHCQANTAADLAREFMTDTGAMTRTLDRMEEKGIIRRARSNADRRVVEVSLTPEGEQIADQMIEAVVDSLNHHLRGFSAEEIAQFKDFLRRMIANA